MQPVDATLFGKQLKTRFESYSSALIKEMSMALANEPNVIELFNRER